MKRNECSSTNSEIKEKNKKTKSQIQKRGFSLMYMTLRGEREGKRVTRERERGGRFERVNPTLPRP